MPPVPTIEKALEAGVTVPESDKTEPTTLSSAFTVTVAPDPAVFKRLPPATVKALAAGTAVPLSVTNEVATSTGVSVFIVNSPT